MPPMVETVPVKQRSTTSAPSPNAPTNCAPPYEEEVEIPISVAENEDARAVAGGSPGRAAQLVEGAAERVRPAGRVPQGRDRHRLHAGHVPEGGHLRGQEDGMLEAHQSQSGRTVHEQGAAPAEVHA